MQLLDEAITEAEVIRLWLDADYNTERESTRQNVLAGLNLPGVGLDPSVLSERGPIDADLEWKLRYALGHCHYWTVGTLPTDIDWQWAEIDGTDRTLLQYIEDFVEMGDGSLTPAAVTDAFRKDTDRDLVAVEAAIRSQQLLPPIIFVAPRPGAALVPLDGNQRLVAYTALGNCWPVRAIVGFSEQVTDWPNYPSHLAGEV